MTCYGECFVDYLMKELDKKHPGWDKKKENEKLKEMGIK